MEKLGHELSSTVNDEQFARDLSNNKREFYSINTSCKTPTELQKELEKIGVIGFVVKVKADGVSMMVERSKVKKNREMIRK